MTLKERLLSVVSVSSGTRSASQHSMCSCPFAKLAVFQLIVRIVQFLVDRLTGVFHQDHRVSEAREGECFIIHAEVLNLRVYVVACMIVQSQFLT